MADNTRVWTVTLDDRQHIITLNWTYWGGMREVLVDGQVVNRDTMMLRWESSQRFTIGNHTCEVVTHPQKVNIIAFEIELFVDGTKVN